MPQRLLCRETVSGQVPPLAGFASTDAEEVVTTDSRDVHVSIAIVVQAVDALGSFDPALLDPHTLATLVEGVEQARRMIEAAATRATAAVDVRTPFEQRGYFNAKTFLTQRCQLSGPEAYRRVQTARMRERLPEWYGAARSGAVGVAQSEAMARVAANPRIDPEVLDRDAGMLLDDATTLPFAEFERNLRTWETLADQAKNSPASSSPRSSPGTAKPSGDSTGRRPASVSVTVPRKPTWCAPSHSGEPTRSSRWRGLR